MAAAPSNGAAAPSSSEAEQPSDLPTGAGSSTSVQNGQGALMNPGEFFQPLVSIASTSPTPQGPILCVTLTSRCCNLLRVCARKPKPGRRRPSQPEQVTHIDETLEQFDMFSTRKPKDVKAGASSGLKSVTKGIVTGAVGLVAAPIQGAKSGGLQA